MIREQYPFETYHEMNLDWLLNKVKELEKKEDGCHCDTESIKKEIQSLKDQIISIQNVNEYQQKEIDELKLPVMQFKNFGGYFKAYDAQTTYSLYTLEAL